MEEFSCRVLPLHVNVGKHFSNQIVIIYIKSVMWVLLKLGPTTFYFKMIKY